MVAYKSKMKISILLFFPIILLGLGIWSIWFDMLLTYKVFSLIFTSLNASVLFYMFIFYIRSPNEAIVINDGKITINTNKSSETYDFKKINEVSFSFNVPYFGIFFSFAIIKKNGEGTLTNCFISNQVRFYKMVKEILIRNNIKITRTLHLYVKRTTDSNL